VSLFFSPPLLHANNSFNEREYRYVAEQVWTFERSFDVAPATLAETAVELVLTGLDTVADVLLNGEKIARCENAHR
jgi:beta-mannosidase